MNNLEQHVSDYLNEFEDHGYESKESFVSDIMRCGCISGMVGHLIYYSDTTKFFEEYKTEINELLNESKENTGLSITELFGDKFDSEDPLCLDTHNQNLLAWFGFEETAYQIAMKEGYNI